MNTFKQSNGNDDDGCFLALEFYKQAGNKGLYFFLNV